MVPDKKFVEIFTLLSLLKNWFVDGGPDIFIPPSHLVVLLAAVLNTILFPKLWEPVNVRDLGTSSEVLPKFNKLPLLFIVIVPEDVIGVVFNVPPDAPLKVPVIFVFPDTFRTPVTLAPVTPSLNLSLVLNVLRVEKTKSNEVELEAVPYEVNTEEIVEPVFAVGIVDIPVLNSKVVPIPGEACNVIRALPV